MNTPATHEPPPTPESEKVSQSSAVARIPVWLWLIAVALLLISFLAARQARQTNRDIAALRRQLNQEIFAGRELSDSRREMEAVLNVLSSPGTREVIPTNPASPALQVRIFWNERLGMILFARNLTPLPASRAYQVWVQSNTNEVASAGVVPASTRNGEFVRLRPVVSENLRVVEVQITEEASSGSSKPSSKPVWQGRVPRAK